MRQADIDEVVASVIKMVADDMINSRKNDCFYYAWFSWSNFGRRQVEKRQNKKQVKYDKY